MTKTITRCPWPTFDDPLYLAYHDKEWGVPVHDDRTIYEFLVLETFQAGLSWRTVLHKRAAFRKAFAAFDPKAVSHFGARDVARLLQDAGIIRNRQKILAAINNAKRFLAVRQEFGTFAAYMWSWVGGRPMVHRFRGLKDYPLFIDEAVAWAKDLKARGFSFLGPTVVYAHMQAVGMVNDHTVACFRYRSSASAGDPRLRREASPGFTRGGMRTRCFGEMSPPGGEADAASKREARRRATWDPGLARGAPSARRAGRRRPQALRVKGDRVLS